MKYYIYQGVGTDGDLQKIAEVTDKKEYTVTGLTANALSRKPLAPTTAYEKVLSQTLSQSIQVLFPFKALRWQLIRQHLKLGEQLRLPLRLRQLMKLTGQQY